MKKKATMSGMLLAMLMVCCGCPYESEFPLGIPEIAQIDRDLTGKWQFSEPGGKETGILFIYPFNEHEFILLSVEEGGEIIAYRAFNTLIDGEKFLSVREIHQSGEQKPWHIVHYSVQKDQMTLRIMEDTLVKNETIETPQGLAECIRKHLHDKELYCEGNEIVFHRYIENRAF